MNPPDTIPMTPEEQKRFGVSEAPDTIPMTAEDVHGLMADPSFTPSPEQARVVWQEEQKRTLGDKVGAFGRNIIPGIKGMVGELGEAHRELGALPFTEEANTQVGKTLASAPLDAARNWLHLGRQAFNYLGNSAYDAVHGASEDERFAHYYDRLLKARNESRAEQKPVIEGALPTTTRALSNVLDPTFLVGGEFVKPVASVGKAAIKAIPGAAKVAEVAGKAAEFAKAAPGAVLEKTGGTLAKVAAWPGKQLESVAENLLGEEGAKAVRGASSIPTAIAGHAAHEALGGIPGGVGEVVAGLKAAQLTGTATERVGQFLSALAKTDESQVPRLLQMAKNPDLPEWLQQLSRAASRTGIGHAAQTIGGLGEGALHGAAMGTALGLATDKSAEESGQIAGGGVVLGTAGRAASKVSGRDAVMRAAKAKQNDLADLYLHLAQKGTPPAVMQKIDTGTAIQAATARKLFGDRLGFTFLDRDAYRTKTGTENAASFDPATNDIAVNVDANRDAITHEIGHAAAKAKGADVQTRAAIDLVLTPQEIAAAGHEYAAQIVDTHLKANGVDPAKIDPGARQQMIADQIAAENAKAGNSNKWIYNEIYADAGWGALAGKDIRREIAPTVREYLGRKFGESAVGRSVASAAVRPFLDALGIEASQTPGAPEKGRLFSNPAIYGPAMRKLVIQHLRDVRNGGAALTAEPALPIDKSKVGTHEALPVYPQPDGTQGNSLYKVTKDGQPIEKTPREIRADDEKRRKEAEKALDAFEKNEIPAEPKPPEPAPVEKPADAEKPTPGEKPAEKPAEKPTPATTPEPDNVVKLRKTVSGLMLRIGEVLPKWFYDLREWSDASKEKARGIEQAIADGDVLTVSYFQAGAGRGKDYADSLQKARGSFTFSLRDVLPFAFQVSKRGEVDVAGRKLKTGGNITVTVIDLATAQTKAQEWSTKGKLADWGGDTGKFFQDFRTYIQNHAEGRPGSAGLDEQRRNVINAFLIGDNVTHRTRNPERQLLTGGDRAGLIRSFRLDRIEMVKPTGEKMGRAEYDKKVLNQSPDTMPRDVIGNVDAYGAVNAKEVEDAAQVNHSHTGLATGRRWRYAPDLNEVIWTNGRPSTEERNAVDNYLQKKGFAPPDHASQSEGKFEVERPQFSPDTPQDREQENRPVVAPFYSQLQKVIEAKMPSRAPAAQVAAMLRNPQHAIKADELKWTGVDDFLKDRLASKEPVTRDELLKVVRDNQIEVKEVLKGAADNTAAQTLADEIDSRQRELDAAIDDHNQNDDSVYDSEYFTAERAEISKMRAELRALEKSLDSSDTKFGKWQVPGGDNYRELLLTLPEQSGKTREQLKNELEEAKEQYRLIFAAAHKTYGDRPNWHPEAERAVSARLDDINRLAKAVDDSNKAEPFRSSHFDEPNILAHARFNERTDADGKRVLFIEELQSDWHQKGRKEGYKLTGAKMWDVVTSSGTSLGNFRTEADALEVARMNTAGGAEVRLIQRDDVIRGVPDAPFKATWHELAFKRMVRWAAEHGFDRVAWTPGDVQAERYDLSKQVDSIQYVKDNDASYRIAAKKDGQFILQETLSPEKLAATVGKDLAEKIVNNEGKREPGEPENFGRFSGVDLKVGGEGMRGFYDKMLVDYANKLGKKFGARVRETEIPAGEEKAFGELVSTDNARAITLAGDTVIAGKQADRRVLTTPEEVATYAAAGYLFERAKKTKTEAVHSLDVTPAMKESVLQQGQAMFSPDTPADPVAKAVAPSDKLESEPGYVYHASNQENARDIIAAKKLNVFRPNYGTDQRTWPDGGPERRSYWSEKAGVVWQFAPEQGKPVILRTKRTEAFQRESTGDVFTRKAVPADAVEILTADGWKPLVEARRAGQPGAKLPDPER
jgi:hypothetical protein